MIILLLIGLAFVVGILWIWLQGNIPKSFNTSEEYRVYSKALTQSSSGDFEVFMIAKQSGIPQFKEYLKDYEKTLVEDFVAINNHNSVLDYKFDLNKKYHILTWWDDQVFRMPGGNGWEKFRKKYPNGSCVNSLSRVGFNQDQTEALVEVKTQCDWLVGSGWLYYLKKIDGIWQIEKQKNTIIS